jgi:hypothetical protein
MAAVPVRSQVFDLLHLDGELTLDLPYTRRRNLLSGLDLVGDTVRVPAHVADVDGRHVLAAAQADGLEGVVAKRLTSTNQPGRRSHDWVKTPLNRTQEVGYKPGGGRRSGTLGSLVLAVPDHTGALTYAGGLAGTQRPADPSRPRFLWLRQRVPLAVLVLIVLGLLWSAYWLLPLLGTHEVDAVVETNRGSSYLCEVSWIDPAGGPGGHGFVSCDRQPGEHLPVQAMGWPRTGTADDPSSVVITGVVADAVLLLVTGLIMGSQAVQRRRLARTAPGDPVHDA